MQFMKQESITLKSLKVEIINHYLHIYTLPKVEIT